MAKKSRQTFQKHQREQAVKERRARKDERREAARIAKNLGYPTDGSVEELGAAREQLGAGREVE